MNDRILYNIVVGYMLKVIHSGVKINDFKDEFNAIKHGDYVTFYKIDKHRNTK
ncbi:MAG: hypothetical protein ACEQSF_02730 [Solirubrobacteraceae bacterium]|jgi:hypothetical protein